MSQNGISCYTTRSLKKHEQSQDFVHKLFNKKFKLSYILDSSYFNVGSLFSSNRWSIKDLQVIKSRLNFHKSQLNDYPIEKWSSHTKRQNPSGDISWQLRQHVNPEFLTQAWTKFYEIVCTYDVVKVKENQIISLHLCEAPGAFITALNHFLRSNLREIKWKWLGSTLNPYYEGNSLFCMITDDRFILHTLQNWEFGLDNTGDIMNWSNSQQIINTAKSIGEVMLVTADGSIDCHEQPDAQEEIVAELHYCEVITALQALSEGGSFVWKLFTMLEDSTVCLLYLLSNVFKEVHIFKPVTSKAGNSEVYAICLQYNGTNLVQTLLPKLQSAYGTKLYKEKSLFTRESIPDIFVQEIVKCAKYFADWQCDVIDNNIATYNIKNVKAYNNLRTLKNNVTYEYMQRYRVRPVVFDDEILKGFLHCDPSARHANNPRLHVGSYTQRVNYSALPLQEKIKELEAETKHLSVLTNNTCERDVMAWHCFYEKDTTSPLEFVYGKPILKLNSSKFLYTPWLRLHEKLLELKNKSPDTNNPKIKDDKVLKLNETIILILREIHKEEMLNQRTQQVFILIMSLLKDLNIGDNLAIFNMSLMTHLNVGLFYVLAKCYFHEVSFCKGTLIVFKNLMCNDCETLNAIEEEIKMKHESLHRIVPPIVTDSGVFYDCIVFYNNEMYRRKTLCLLKSIHRV